MLANELIDRLERRGLLDQEIIEALRDQLTEGGARVTPEAVAKLLVDNGQLTRFQASKLIGELRNDDDDEEAVEVVDDLTGLPEDDLIASEEAVDVFEAEAVVVDAVPVEAVPVEAVAVAEAVAVDGVADVDMPERPQRKKPAGRIKPPEHKSVWDSFKIYGYLGIIGFLIIAGGSFYWILTKQSADDIIGIADKQYDAGSFQPAQAAYQSFIEQFGEGNQYSSKARVRIAMAELYRSADMTDTTKAIDKAKEVLPGIVEEEGMDLERGNLAALLVDIAANIAEAAGKETVTEEKQQLLNRLDEQQTLIDDPNYMLTSMKATLSGQLLEISEARNRVKRDIDRNIRLDETEAAMKTALDENNTKEAYDLRKSLLRDFPELGTDPRLVTLIDRASELQQTLVVSSKQKPEPLTTPLDTGSLQEIVLTTRQGAPIPGLENETYFLRAGGSVLAFNAGDGRLLWRQYTGYGLDHIPQRLENGEAVLLSDVGTNEVRRVRGEDGALEWRTPVEESFAEPTIGRDSILVSARSGRLLSLDADSGEADWVAQLPQELNTPAQIDDRVRRVYVPGNHSNLYVINARDGSCIESYYIGHEEGTIAVAPISLLGHLFVIENKGSDFAQMHVLRMDDEGNNLKKAQASFRLVGNVLVPPIIQQRRMIVLTDRGQVAVYDIEPTSEREQVSKIAEQVASYDVPTKTQMAVGRSQMWITGTRVGRYELQINTGRVVYDWGKAEGDSFIGQPLALEDTLIHARVLRGTSAIRVTAAEPKTGNELWRTDVGTPISFLTPVPGKNEFHAITSQGALFQLDRDSLTSGSTQGPIENPGADSISMRFRNPVRVDETRRVLLNESQPGEAMIYDPNRRSEKLRKITFGLTGPKPTGEGIFSGGGIFLPVDSGRAVLVDWQTGKVKGAPFQPASDPVGTVSWAEPVTVSDDPNQVVIGDSRKKLYRLRVGEQMTELASTDLAKPFLGSAINIDGQYVAGISGPAADFLAGHDEMSLERKFQKLLDGRISWGPYKAVTPGGDEIAILMTNDQTLRGFNGKGDQVFDTKLKFKGVPVPEVVSIQERWVITGKQGWLVSLDPKSGTVVGDVQLGQPLSASPLPVGNKLLVPGAEGVVYITNIPGAN